jgi:TRAP-type transport system periplasmic protein
MRKIFFGVLEILLVTSLIFAGRAQAAPAKVVEFRFAHEMPAESDNHKLLWAPWANDIAKATNGRVKVTIYPGETLGATDTYVEAVRSGMIDIAWISLEFFEGRWPLSMVGYYPIGVKTPGTLSYVWWDLYKEFPEMKAEYPGVKVLAVYGGTPKQVFTSKRFSKDIRTVADMKGFKIKVGGGPFNEAVVALGAAPVTMPAPHQYEGLQKGTIDGSWFELGDGVSFVLQEVCRSVAVINAPGCGFALIMSPASFAKMSTQDQKIFDGLCGDAYTTRAAKFYYKLDNGAAATLTKAGCGVINPAAKDYDEFQKAIGIITAKWEASTNAKGKPATKVLSRAKELAVKWEAAKWWTK